METGGLKICFQDSLTGGLLGVEGIEGVEGVRSWRVGSNVVLPGRAKPRHPEMISAPRYAPARVRRGSAWKRQREKGVRGGEPLFGEFLSRAAAL